MSPYFEKNYLHFGFDIGSYYRDFTVVHEEMKKTHRETEGLSGWDFVYTSKDNKTIRLSYYWFGRIILNYEDCTIYYDDISNKVTCIVFHNEKGQTHAVFNPAKINGHIDEEVQVYWRHSGVDYSTEVSDYMKDINYLMDEDDYIKMWMEIL